MCRHIPPCHAVAAPRTKGRCRHAPHIHEAAGRVIHSPSAAGRGMIRRSFAVKKGRLFHRRLCCAPRGCGQGRAWRFGKDIRHGGNLWFGTTHVRGMRAMPTPVELCTRMTTAPAQACSLAWERCWYARACCCSPLAARRGAHVCCWAGNFQAISRVPSHPSLPGPSHCNVVVVRVQCCEEAISHPLRVSRTPGLLGWDGHLLAAACLVFVLAFHRSKKVPVATRLATSVEAHPRAGAGCSHAPLVSGAWAP